MSQLVAIEYREAQWGSVRELAGRAARVADECAQRGLGAVGVASLLTGRVQGLWGMEAPAVVFGLRARSAEAVVAVGQALSVRGYTGVFGLLGNGLSTLGRRGQQAVLGHGMVAAAGADQTLIEMTPQQVRRRFQQQRPADGHPPIWMPKPDRLDRAVDGMVLEEARRAGVALLWAPGDGINGVDEPPDSPGPVVVQARVDDGAYGVERLGKWAGGHRMERGRMRLQDLGSQPRRWLRQLTGLR